MASLTPHIFELNFPENAYGADDRLLSPWTILNDYLITQLSWGLTQHPNADTPKLAEKRPREHPQHPNNMTAVSAALITALLENKKIIIEFSGTEYDTWLSPTDWRNSGTRREDTNDAIVWKIDASLFSKEVYFSKNNQGGGYLDYLKSVENFLNGAGHNEFLAESLEYKNSYKMVSSYTYFGEAMTSIDNRLDDPNDKTVQAYVDSRIKNQVTTWTAETAKKVWREFAAKYMMQAVSESHEYEYLVDKRQWVRLPSIEVEGQTHIDALWKRTDALFKRDEAGIHEVPEVRMGAFEQ